MTGQLNPFRLRAPSVSVSASDLMKGQAQLGSHLKGGITGLSQFGQQQNTNELNDLIARGELEGMSTDEAQRTIAELGLTGGVTKDMGKFMEQGHQGRQQEDRQRQATDVASTLFSRQEDTARQKAQTAKDLVDYKNANPTAKSLINTGAGIYDPNEKKWIAGPDGTTKQPFKPTGQIGSAFKNATKNGKMAIELGASMDPNFNVRPVKIGKDKSGNDKFSKTNFEYLYNGNVYANPETLLADIERSQEQQGKQPTVIGGPDARPVNPSQVNAEDIGPMDTRGLEGMFDRTMDLFGGKDEASKVTANQLLTGDNTTAGKVDAGEIPENIVAHLQEREGVVGKSYRDSLGKPTGGMGHLLSEAEKKKYPVGTQIPDDVVSRWAKEDSKKAFDNAKKEAKVLGNMSPEFIQALTAVNFQLGTSWKKKFKTTFQDIKDRNIGSAIKKIQNSKWMKQTPTRANDFIKALRETQN